MEIFEYLPQLIIAYDGKSDDKFANLIHISKADKDKDYYCPCCGGAVRPRALNSTKEQSHYYHLSGLCTKESQLHFFCKNWLFDVGSQFYVDDNLYTVDYVGIEKIWNTKFGDYKPDVTVYTSTGEIIYFEMFFSNRKTGDDYFCKWNDLGNDVVEVNIKEYMYKSDINTIPKFTYLYHDGKCYAKEYIKRDFYANHIQKLKNKITRQDLLNYRQRIEQFDWLWQSIMDETQRQQIPEIIQAMNYEDQVACYEIIKKKNCVKYLKDIVLQIINDGVEQQIRNQIALPKDDEILFGFEHKYGRTYRAGIKIVFNSKHISYNKIHCRENSFDIVFKRKLFSANDVELPKDVANGMQRDYDKTVKFKEQLLALEPKIAKLEEDKYKIRNKNGRYTVLAKIHGEKYELLFSDFKPYNLFSINELDNHIQDSLQEVYDKDYMEDIHNNENYISFCNQLKQLKKEKFIDCRIDLEYNSGIHLTGCVDYYCIYDTVLDNDFNERLIELQDCFNKLLQKYDVVLNIVQRINNCKNGFWTASFCLPHVNLMVKLDDIYYERQINLNTFDFSSEKKTVTKFKKTMYKLIDDLELYHGYRVFLGGDIDE
jgi:hypothetical protein